MFVGYTLEHAGDCYRICDPKTGRIRISRDISWLNKMYFSNPPDSQAEKSTPTTNEFSCDYAADNDHHSVTNLSITSTPDNPDTNDRDLQLNSTDDNATSTDESEAKSVHEDNRDIEDDNNSETEHVENDKGEWKTVTKSGRQSYAPKRLLYPSNADTANSAFTVTETNYYSVLSNMDGFEPQKQHSLLDVK